MTDAPATLVWGDSGSMREIGDRTVDLVLTSPPYFSPETESLLAQPSQSQRDLDTIARLLSVFASGLRPSFREMFRVLRAGRAAVIQTKDIRYGDVLLPVAALHRQDLEAAGFRLHERIFWWRRWGKNRRAASFLAGRNLCGFRVDDVEEFLVFFKGDPAPPASSGRRELSAQEAESWATPLWDVRPQPFRRAHPFEMPAEIARRMIEIYSAPGEFVLDPFAGSATTLLAARDLGRRSAGYEIDRSQWESATERVRESDRESG